MRRWFFTALGMTLLLGLPGVGAVSMFQSPISATTELDGAESGDVEPDDDGTGDDGTGGEVVEEPTTTTVVEPVPEPEPAPDPDPEARPEGDQRAREALRRCLAHHNVRDIDRLLAEHSPRELLRRCMAHHRRPDGERPVDRPAAPTDEAPVDEAPVVEPPAADVSGQTAGRTRR